MRRVVCEQLKESGLFRHEVDVERETVTYSASLHLLMWLVLVITRRRVDYIDSNYIIRFYRRRFIP